MSPGYLGHFFVWETALDLRVPLVSEGGELRLKLESKLSSVEAAELIVQRLAQQHLFAEDLIGQLGMAERACTANAVTHGNGYSSEELVFLSVATEPSHKEQEVSLSTSIREKDGVTIVDLSGPITLGEASEKLRDTVRESLSKGQKKILLNLGAVGYIDSSGLGQLVSSYATASKQGATVKLLNVGQKVNDLLQITKLYTVFDIFGNETEAVLSFSG